MKNAKKFGIIFVVTFAAIIITNPIYAQSELLPSWMKTTAKFWSDDKISDMEFISFIQFLIDEKIIFIPDNKESDSSQKIISKESICIEFYNEMVELVSMLQGTEQKLNELLIYEAFSQDRTAEEDLENVREEIKRLQFELLLEYKDNIEKWGDMSYCKNILTKTQIDTILFLDEGRIT